MRLFLDTNVLIDVVMNRKPWVDDAIKAQWNDMEDCTQYYAARREKADYIITRNVKDFSQSDIPVFLPNDFLNLFLK